MFWNSKITILFITRSNIDSAVLTAHGRVVKGIRTYAWDNESLPAVLREISSRGPSRARAIFSEDFSYVTSFELKDKSRGAVLDKAKEIIPDELDNNWDFKQSGGADFSSQVAAVESRYFNDFSDAFGESGLKVEAIEPQSIALARLLPQVGLFLFIADYYEKVLLGVVKNGVVLATHITKDQEIIATLENFLPYVKNKYQSALEKVFVGQNINPDSEVFLKNDLKAEVFALDPFRGMALKKDITGEDAQVLNINPKNNIKLVEKKTEKTEKTEKRSGTTLREKFLIILFATFLIIAGLVIFIKIR